MCPAFVKNLEACDLARKNLKSAQNCMKSKFDKNTVAWNFQAGDKIQDTSIPSGPLNALAG